MCPITQEQVVVSHPQWVWGSHCSPASQGWSQGEGWRVPKVPRCARGRASSPRPRAVAGAARRPSPLRNPPLARGGARNASITARGANARTAGAPASASTSASGANARTVHAAWGEHGRKVSSIGGKLAGGYAEGEGAAPVQSLPRAWAIPTASLCWPTTPAWPARGTPSECSHPSVRARAQRRERQTPGWRHSKSTLTRRCDSNVNQHTHTHTYAHTHSLSLSLSLSHTHTHTYAHTHTHTLTHSHTHTHTHTHTPTRIYRTHSRYTGSAHGAGASGCLTHTYRERKRERERDAEHILSYR